MPDRNDRPPRVDDLLAAYELGLLDEAERARVEAALREDVALLEDLYDAAPETSVLLADPGRFAAVAAAAGTSAKASPSRSSRWLAALRRPRLAAPLAAAAALAAVLLWPGGADDLASLATVEPLPATRLELRAAAPDADARFGEAMDAYRRGDWSAAADAFAVAVGQAGPAWPRLAQAQLYAGSSLLLAGRPQQARTPLTAAAASTLAPIREQALWQLAQAHLLLDDPAAARETLTPLADSPVFGARARALQATLAAEN